MEADKVTSIGLIKVYFSDSSLHDTVGTGQARTGINTG